jgi:inhibitor of cysteine peptidase
MIHIDDSFTDQVVQLTVGQVIELRLKENPTTGFRWSFAADGQPACAVISDNFDPPHGLPGAGGEHTWQIKAVHAGNCYLQLLYQRSFGPKDPARTFELKVQVTE